MQEKIFEKLESQDEKSPGDVFSVALLFLASFGLLLLRIWSTPDAYDEGIYVFGAEHILHGEIPYRDFWATKLPGQFYALAMLFRLFGTSLTAERIYSIILYSLVTVLAYCLAKQLVSQKLALLSWFITLIWLMAFGFLMYAIPTPPAIAAGMLSCLFVIGFILKRQRWRLAAAGMLTGVTMLFRQDFGVYALMCETAIILLYTFMSIQDGRKGVGEALKMWVVYLAGIGLIAFPALSLILYQTPMREIMYQLVLWPSTVWKEFRSLPYPAPLPNPVNLMAGNQPIPEYAHDCLRRVPFYFPVFILLSTFFVILANLRKRERVPARHWIIFFYFVVGVSFLPYAFLRSDQVHLFPVTIWAAILLPSLLLDVRGNLRLIGFFPLVIIPLMLVSLIYNPFNSILPKPSIELVSLHLPRANGIRLPRDEAEDLSDAVRLVEEVVPEEDAIFVANERHDLGTINHVLFYFLADRKSATKYWVFEPGLTTTIEIQRKIIDDLERSKVKCVVVCDIPRGIEPNGSSISSGAGELDKYIRDTFRETARFGTYAVLLRR